MIPTRYATLIVVALLACTAVMVTGNSTATDAPTPASLAANNTTTTPAGPTTSTPTPNGSLTPADILAIVTSVDAANVSRDRLDDLTAWASDPANVRTLSASEARQLRLWLLEAGRAASISLEVPALSLRFEANETQIPKSDREPENNSSTPAASYGVVDELSRNPGNVSAQQVDQTIVDGLYVLETEFHREGYALVTVVVTTPSMTFSATDSNSIGERGSGQVAAELVELPRGKFRVKVPASVRNGDQTVVIGVNVEHSYWFSNHETTGGEGLLSQVDGWTPWVGGLAAGLTWVVIAGFVVLAGEQTGVEIAGEAQ